jgi:excisionase family DNA binding protein
LRRPPVAVPEKSTVHDRPFNVQMLAERWGCTPSHIYHLIRKGHLRTFKIGQHSIRISVQEVERIEKGDVFCAEESGAPVSEAGSDDLYVPRTEL